jgi:hypothetical protein
MANCFIPNSSPANGRISTRSLRRSRKQNSQPRASFSVIRRSAFSLQKRRQVRHLESVRWRTGAFQSETAARKIQSAICNRQSAIRRVKGAWWPSRSSKSSSPRKWRGRFDSYPLRQIIFDCRLPIVDCPRHRSKDFNRKSQFENRELAERR